MSATLKIGEGYTLALGGKIYEAGKHIQEELLTKKDLDFHINYGSIVKIEDKKIEDKKIEDKKEDIEPKKGKK